MITTYKETFVDCNKNISWFALFRIFKKLNLEREEGEREGKELFLPARSN